jgi:hypothetical protein
MQLALNSSAVAAHGLSGRHHALTACCVCAHTVSLCVDGVLGLCLLCIVVHVQQSLCTALGFSSCTRNGHCTQPQDMVVEPRDILAFNAAGFASACEAMARAAMAHACGTCVDAHMHAGKRVSGR